MQASQRQLRRLHFLIVAAFVMVVARVQRLVNVPHQMKHELECDQPFRRIRRRILQLRDECLEPIDDARLRRPFRCFG